MKFINSVNAKRLIASIITFCIVIFSTTVFGQETSDRHRTYINMGYIKSGDQTFLSAALTARVQGVRGRTRIEDAEIRFYQLLETGQSFLGTAVTNENGDAKFLLPESIDLRLNEDGAFAFGAIFEGNDEFSNVSEEISILPATLDIAFREVDSVKYIVVSAYQLSDNGEQMPVNEDVMVYVPRQFSRLTIGKIELDEGEGEVEFPVTLPGDSIGNLNIIARIEDSRDYGTLEVQAVKDWGAIRKPIVIEQRRGLGDTDAPLWMVYTLIILMSAVWFHYLYLLYTLYLIKHKGKKKHIIA